MITKIGIIGLGLIGGSIAKAIRKVPGDYIIGAYDKNEVLDTALEENVIDSKISQITDVKEYELIFLCLPVDLSLEIFEELCSVLDEKNILTDVCSVKGEFAKIFQTSNSNLLYVGGHPMTGKEIGGYKNSDALLFENSVYVISEDAKNKPEAGELFNLIEMMGANVIFIDPFVHDEIVASVSHLPQIVSVALMNSIKKNKSKINYANFAAGGFRDMTRIASSDFKLWEPIINQNREKILTAIDNFQSTLQNLKSMIESSDSQNISSVFERARFLRDEIPKDTKGFLTPLYDLFVFVKDEPGVVSRISTALFDEDINIKDIELLKIREGTGGTFRLSFSNLETVNRAERIIHTMGFETKKN